LLFALLAGCTVGPDYNAPAKPSEDAYHISQATISGDPEHGIPQQVFERATRVRSDWYHIFGSDKLDALIGHAIEDSPTLAAGRSRIKAAREVVTQNRAALYPHLGAGVGYSRKRTTGVETGSTDSALTNVFNLYDTQVTADYHLDLFGKTRRRIERSNANLEVQRFEVLDTYVTLINNIVATAIAEAGLNAAIDTTHQIARTEADALAIVRKQIKYGVAIKSDATQIRTQLARTRASLEPLRKQKTLAVNRLAVLIGSAPGHFDDPDFTLTHLQLPQKLPVSLPSQLVQQRPDIRAAAATVHAASAQIGIATANLLPDLSISGTYGRAALTPGDLTNPAYALYSLGASIAAPLFEGGRLRAAKHQAQDLYLAALADYRTTLLTAFGEVANSLRSIEADARAIQAQQTALDAARDNLTTVQTQVRNGVADYEHLYTAQSQFQSAKLDFVKARETRYRDTADLFRALGGGWAQTSNGLPAADHDEQAGATIAPAGQPRQHS
jgi:NodT family efflux transporter outer membrane factor (OMF) lipoprotein